MTLPLPLRIALRDLRGGLRGFRVFVLCLMLGVAAIAAVGIVRDAIARALADQGAVLLGGDAQVSFTYRFAHLNPLADHHPVADVPAGLPPGKPGAGL